MGTPVRSLATPPPAGASGSSPCAPSPTSCTPSSSASRRPRRRSPRPSATKSSGHAGPPCSVVHLPHRLHLPHALRLLHRQARPLRPVHGRRPDWLHLLRHHLQVRRRLPRVPHWPGQVPRRDGGLPRPRRRGVRGPRRLRLSAQLPSCRQHTWALGTCQLLPCRKRPSIVEVASCR